MPKKSPAKSIKRKRATKKDKDAPKRSLSAYMFYSREMRPLVKEEAPELKFGDVAKKIGGMWKSLEGDDKKKYEALAAQDKSRYIKEKEEYEKKIKAKRENQNSDEDEGGDGNTSNSYESEEDDE